MLNVGLGVIVLCECNSLPYPGDVEQYITQSVWGSSARQKDDVFFVYLSLFHFNKSDAAL